MSAIGGNRGPIVSTTVTLNDALELLPRGSDAVQVTVVVPTGKAVFGGGEQATLAPALPASSAVGGMKKTTAPSAPVACAKIGCGTVLIGAPSALDATPIDGAVPSSADGESND